MRRDEAAGGKASVSSQGVSSLKQETGVLQQRQGSFNKKCVLQEVKGHLLSTVVL